MGIVTAVTNKYQKCIDACNQCAQACYECFKACLNEPDIAARRGHISSLMECAKICEMSSTFMAMDSQHAKHICKTCATICDMCAQDCSTFKDDHCQKCADVCRNCANECRMMSGM